MVRFVVALGLVLLCGLAAPAHAETHRIAIVLGNNVGTGESPPLHYAELDADKLSQALVELGGVPPHDLHLLRGATIGEVHRAFDRATAQIAAWRAQPEARSVLIFYFSGHSDGEALELGTDRLAFAQLRGWLAATGADVRVAIVDSCRSGALLAAKGGKPGVGFQIRLSDTVASNGEALLTSSAADELALESREIRGSFFTHHLVSGLRGAADLSGDGNVTLAEAYQYAFAHTVVTTAATTYGPQHPTYDYRLAGEGELVIASTSAPLAHVTLPDGFDRILLIHTNRDQVIAELPRGARRALSVPAGSYEVRAWRGATSYAGRIVLRESEALAMRGDELHQIALPVTGAKGSIADVSERVADRPTCLACRPSLTILPGWQRGTAGADLFALSVAVRGATSRGWIASLDLATGTGLGFRELDLAGLAGYVLSVGSARVRGDASLQLGAGVTSQMRDAGGTFKSASLLAVPALGGTAALTSRLALRAQLQLSTLLLARDHAAAVIFEPSALFGIALAL